MIKALAHPMRTRILGMLDERVASPRQLSDELDAPLQNVSYHVRELAKLRLIKLVRTTQRRGAIEHHYKAVAAPHVSDKTWRELPPIVRQRMTAAGLSEILTQVNDAAAGGGFVADDAHLSRRFRAQLPGGLGVADGAHGMSRCRRIGDSRGWRQARPDSEKVRTN